MLAGRIFYASFASAHHKVSCQMGGDLHYKVEAASNLSRLNTSSVGQTLEHEIAAVRAFVARLACQFGCPRPVDTIISNCT